MITSFDIIPATTDDAPMLADIRVEAMRPSLEALNRFDPVRARQRFLSGFAKQETFIICCQNEVIGFYVLRDYVDHLYLDHLYLKNKFQGKGFGRKVIEHIQNVAVNADKAIKLIALKKSPANDFYISAGFNFEQAEGVDNHYIWQMNKA